MHIHVSGRHFLEIRRFSVYSQCTCRCSAPLAWRKNL